LTTLQRAALFQLQVAVEAAVDSLPSHATYTSEMLAPGRSPLVLAVAAEQPPQKEN
jgi:hypothetical protein